MKKVKWLAVQRPKKDGGTAWSVKNEEDGIWIANIPYMEGGQDEAMAHLIAELPRICSDNYALRSNLTKALNHLHESIMEWDSTHPQFQKFNQFLELFKEQDETEEISAIQAIEEPKIIVL
jgi:hypothetical protein